MKRINPTQKQIVLFEENEVRRIWDNKKELWFFSVVDIIKVLVDSSIPKRYWSDLKTKLKNEGSEVYEKIVQLKLVASDGKMYETDCFSTENMLRIIQAIPSKKAEPIKLWLAKVGYERMQEIINPDLSIDRAREQWKKSGRSNNWIQQRMMGQETRNKLTDFWKESGVKEGKEFALLTELIHKEWSEVSTTEHKKLKGLKKENLRDHMSEAELIFTALAEMSTRSIAEGMQARGLEQNKVPAKQGGKLAKDARRALELKTGKSVITEKNFLSEKEMRKLK